MSNKKRILMDGNAFRREIKNGRLYVIRGIRKLVINDTYGNQGFSYQISETIFHCSLKKRRYDIPTSESAILQVGKMFDNCESIRKSLS